MLAEPSLLVVVVEDDEAVRSALAFALEMEGYRVKTCETGEALMLLDLPAAGACLVVDERLPGITGLEALRQLRARGNTLPCVVITSNPGPRTRAAAEAAGAAILEKPLLCDGLTALVREALVA